MKLTSPRVKDCLRSKGSGLPLSEDQVSEITEMLNEKQRQYVEDRVKQDKKSKWIEELAKCKGIVLEPGMDMNDVVEKLDDWILVDILDGGYGKRPFNCECGKSLRFQYIVHHKRENKTYKLGQTCFEYYTDLPPGVLKSIKDGFYNINLERDQILVKFYKGEEFDIDPYVYLDLPEDIIKPLGLGLPLTDRQILRIKKLDGDYKIKHEEDKAAEVLEEIKSQLTPEQREFIYSNYDEKQIKNIMDKLQADYIIYKVDKLQGLGIPNIILSHIRLELPLLDSQEFIVEARIKAHKKKTRNSN